VLGRVPPGGSILDVPAELRPKSCFANTYARLWWERPSTTITRNFGTPSSSRCIHPLFDRGLTTREGARLQSFPDRYEFAARASARTSDRQRGAAAARRSAGREIFRALAAP
jgi:DNA (cytosine-5)-methyltransferase 1